MNKSNVFRSSNFYAEVNDIIHLRIKDLSGGDVSISLNSGEGSETEEEDALNIGLTNASRAFIPAMCLIRNKELDNTLSLTDSTKLTISAINNKIITVNDLPDYLYFNKTGWAAMLCDIDKTTTTDPTPTGDYLYKNFCTVDRNAKTLTFGATTNLTGWEVGDVLILYNPFLNYEFIGNQSNSPFLSVSGAPAWRSSQTGSGPMFRHSDGRFIWLFTGYQSSPTRGRVGYAYTTDMINWTVGNGDNYVFDAITAGIPDCTSINLCGNAYPTNDGTGRYWCPFFYAKTSDGHGAHRILYFDEDLTTFTYSGIIMADRELGFAGGTIMQIGAEYHFIYMLIANAGITFRSINAAKSANLEGLYVDYQTDIVIGAGGGANDGVAWSHAVDAPAMFNDNVNTWGLFGATSQYSQSGNKGNREYCFLNFDQSSETWSVDDVGPVIINPFYYQNINNTYLWAGDHTGGYPAFFMEGDDIYASLTMKGLVYEGTVLKLKK